MCTAVLAGCGGSQRSTSSSSSVTTRASVKNTPVASASVKAISPAPTSTLTRDPCTFVPAAAAAKILGVRALHESEAPLGPTCILQVTGQKQYVTISVQAIDLKREVAQMSKPTQLTIGGHTAYCGKLGITLLLVELGNGLALHVAAPCATGEALATKALPHIIS